MPFYFGEFVWDLNVKRGVVALYRGTIKNGKPDGAGIAKLLDAKNGRRIFVGTWRDGRRCGLGAEFEEAT